MNKKQQNAAPSNIGIGNKCEHALNVTLQVSHDFKKELQVQSRDAAFGPFAIVIVADKLIDRKSKSLVTFFRIEGKTVKDTILDVLCNTIKKVHQWAINILAPRNKTWSSHLGGTTASQHTLSL